MKIFAALFLASISPASAFVTPVAERRCLPLRMSDPRQEDTWGGVGVEVKNVTPPGTSQRKEPEMSKSLPFMTCPAVLDGSMAGDVGFDPLGFSKSKGDLTFYREAEIKHARLAMLAAAGWPLSELFDKKIANLIGMTPVLDATNRVPSVLNGGLGKISPVYWTACLVLAGAVDVFALSQATKKDGYFAGDLGFDPLGMYPSDKAEQKKMQTAEIKNGRLAMIAITAFAAQEFVAETAVIDQAPLFFKPIWEVISDYGATHWELIPAEETPAVVEAVTSPVDAAAVFTPAVIAPVDTVSAAAVIAPVDTVSAAAVIAPVETVSAASVIAPVDTVSAAVVTPPIDAVSTPSVPTVSAVSPPVDDADLVAAKKRIAELEEKLASIGNLTR